MPNYVKIKNFMRIITSRSKNIITKLESQIPYSNTNTTRLK